MTIQPLLHKILQGENLSESEAYMLSQVDSEQLFEAATSVTDHFFPDRKFDSCSIVNARSGRCGEDCKWCAQAVRYNTGCDDYDLVDEKQCVDLGRFYDENGVGRYSLVTSGRKLSGASLDKVCAMYSDMRRQLSIGLCASLGLLGDEDMKKLSESGVTRYHCNLETAPSHFPSLCTTHTQQQKLLTIEAARRNGMEICSGGIIGMGETETQRIEFALTLRSIDPVSIPVNILCPIPGTPLEHQPPLTDDEILRSVAIFRLVNPKAVLRFAGGRKLLSRDVQLKALKMGVNGAIVGDLLTTIGSRINEDRELAAEAGLTF